MNSAKHLSCNGALHTGWEFPLVVLVLHTVHHQ